MAFTLFDNPHLVTDDKELVTEVTKSPRKQTRNIFLRTYEPKEVIDLWLRETAPTEWAMVYHDKDSLKDGSPKEPHWHVIASWKNPASPTRYKYLTKFFGRSDQQTFIEHAMNLRSATEYLWHKNSPDKYQYRQEDLISFGLDRLLETKKDEKERDNETFIDDLQSLSRYELGVKYGRDYMKNFRRYSDFVGDIAFQTCQSAVARLAFVWDALKDYDTDARCWTLRKQAINVIATALDKIARLGTGSRDLASAYAVETFANAICEAAYSLTPVADMYLNEDRELCVDVEVPQ